MCWKAIVKINEVNCMSCAVTQNRKDRVEITKYEHAGTNEAKEE